MEESFTGAVIVGALHAASEIHFLFGCRIDDAGAWMFRFIFGSEVGFLHFAADHAAFFEYRFPYDASPEYLSRFLDVAFFDEDVSFDEDVVSNCTVCDLAEWSDCHVFAECAIFDDAGRMDISHDAVHCM